MRRIVENKKISFDGWFKANDGSFRFVVNAKEPKEFIDEELLIDKGARF